MLTKYLPYWPKMLRSPCLCPGQPDEEARLQDSDGNPARGRWDKDLGGDQGEEALC